MKNEKFIRRWEKTRQKGKETYILTTGLAMGTGMFIGTVVSSLITNRDLFDSFMNFEYFIGGFAGGIIGSIINWPRYEKKYNELVNNSFNE